MVVLKKAQNDSMVLLLDDDGWVYSFSRKHLIKYLQASGDYQFFYAARLANKDGALRDDSFEPSQVYFLDMGERMPLEDAKEIIGDKTLDKALSNKSKYKKKQEKREKYSEMEF